MVDGGKPGVGSRDGGEAYWKERSLNIERREERQKLRGESVCRIIEMNVKVTGDDKFMGSGCSKGEKRTEVIEEDREWFRMTGQRWRTINIED